MRYRKSRKFRHRSNGRSFQHRNGVDQARIRPNTFSNDRPRNGVKTTQGAEKLIERYNSLAKEALSSGDKILAENYFQYADHFLRILDERKINQNQIVEEKKIFNNNPEQKNNLVKDQTTKEEKE